jgi:hypothetical protein
MADKIKTRTGEDKFVQALPAIAFILVAVAALFMFLK